MQVVLFLVLLFSPFYVIRASYLVEGVSFGNPYQTLACGKLQVDEIGRRAVDLVSYEIKQSQQSLWIQVHQQLLLCARPEAVSGSPHLFWQKVNPFVGYKVPYFDLVNKRESAGWEQIDVKNSADGIYLYLATETSYWVAKAYLNGRGLLEASFKINKDELLNDQDDWEIKKGKRIKKTLNLSTRMRISGSFHVDGYWTESFSPRDVELFLAPKPSMPPRFFNNNSGVN